MAKIAAAKSAVYAQVLAESAAATAAEARAAAAAASYRSGNGPEDRASGGPFSQAPQAIHSYFRSFLVT